MDKIAEELMSVAKELVAAGSKDAYAVRDDAAKQMEQLAKLVKNIGIWESAYSFGDHGPKYKRGIDSKMAKLASAVDKATKEITKLVKDVENVTAK